MIMQIAIIETDIPRARLADRFGHYGQIFAQWLSPALPEAEFTAFAAYADAPLPKPEDFDGYMITGSRHGVYDALPWMARVIEHIQAARTARIPVGGICFGHQIMAKAYGGTVEKSTQGWVLGRESYTSAENPEAKKSVFAIHQDQVVALPDSVVAVQSSPRVPYGRLEYDFPALSVQYHPEFFPAFYRQLMLLLRGDVIDPALVDPALASINKGTDGALLAQDFAKFFVQNRPNIAYSV